MMTVDEFENYLALPANSGRSFELIAGEVVEVAPDDYAAQIGAFIVSMLSVFARPRGLGRVTGADGGYVIGDERYFPDAAFSAKQQRTGILYSGYNALAPDLAVEILSSAKNDVAVRIKVVNYLRIGTAVWVVDPDAQRVEVYAFDAPPRLAHIGDVLDGGSVLPGFTLPVAEIFGAE
jgi:Uma2 family endonuclease